MGFMELQAFAGDAAKSHVQTQKYNTKPFSYLVCYANVVNFVKKNFIKASKIS